MESILTSFRLTSRFDMESNLYIKGKKDVKCENVIKIPLLHFTGLLPDNSLCILIQMFLRYWNSVLKNSFHRFKE